MSPELSKQLAELAQKLGTSASQLWPILVMRARLDAIISLVFDVAVLTIIAIVMPKLAKQCGEHKGFQYDSIWDDMGRPVTIVILALVGVLCFADVFLSVPKIIYPQVEALKSIVGG